MVNNGDFEIISRTGNEVQAAPCSDQIVGILADNAGRMLDLAMEIVDIKRMQLQTDAYVGILRERTRAMREEADAYVKRLGAETDSVVRKVEIIRNMMMDYYKEGNTNLSGEVFAEIMEVIISGMELK